MSQISFGQNQVGMVFDNGSLKFDENDVYEGFFSTENGVLLVFALAPETGPSFHSGNLPAGWRSLGVSSLTPGFPYEQGPNLWMFATNSENVSSSTSLPYGGSAGMRYAVCRMVHNARVDSIAYSTSASAPSTTNPLSLRTPSVGVTWGQFRTLGVFVRGLDDSTVDPGFSVEPGFEPEVVVSGGAFYVAGSFNGRLFLDIFAPTEDVTGGGTAAGYAELNSPSSGTYVGFMKNVIVLEYQEPVTVDPEPEPEPDSCSKTVNINITINGECDVQVDPVE